MMRRFGFEVPVLPVAVRNIVVARATAGAYDPTETTYKAIQACRQAAREKMGMGRLNPAQADAVDALVISARVAAHERGSFSVKGKTMVMEPLVFAPAQPKLIDKQGREEERDTMKAILAVLLRMERFFVAVAALLFRRGSAAPALLAEHAAPPPAPLPAAYGVRHLSERN